jgi:hypothetical protein
MEKVMMTNLKNEEHFSVEVAKLIGECCKRNITVKFTKSADKIVLIVLDKNGKLMSKISFYELFEPSSLLKRLEERFKDEK